MFTKMVPCYIPFRSTTLHQTQVFIFVCGDCQMLFTNCKWNVGGIFHQVGRNKWNHLQTAKKQYKFHHYMLIFKAITATKLLRWIKYKNKREKKQVAKLKGKTLKQKKNMEIKLVYPSSFHEMKEVERALD